MSKVTHRRAVSGGAISPTIAATISALDRAVADYARGIDLSGRQRAAVDRAARRRLPARYRKALRPNDRGTISADPELLASARDLYSKHYNNLLRRSPDSGYRTFCKAETVALSAARKLAGLPSRSVADSTAKLEAVIRASRPIESSDTAAIADHHVRPILLAVASDLRRVASPAAR